MFFARRCLRRRVFTRVHELRGSRLHHASVLVRSTVVNQSSRQPAFRRVCQRDTGLLLAAAAGREYSTFCALIGLVRVDATEADALPRNMKNRSVDRDCSLASGCGSLA